ncbi:TadE/TadG family type IV pilus assembly protein [Erythrobacter ani]|uniref:Pilus assembly protein n=1 Tax=Erythrobacter ani TaxID=2827235 RepID=A0ABS6SPR0_9SPHN|nr:TadE family protein [Erythrobacter ani]MBV7267026.1 pilus assembly protein [Erythrobacter ani]
MIMIARIANIARDVRGSMAIETAFVAPMLVMMTLGIFEVGTVVARQHELQSAANEAEIIVLATNRGATVELSEIENILKNSVGVTGESLTVEREFRCGMANGKIKVRSNCPASGVTSEYILVSLTDTYTPTWTSFGIGQPITFSVDRSVQIS